MSSATTSGGGGGAQTEDAVAPMQSALGTAAAQGEGESQPLFVSFNQDSGCFAVGFEFTT